MNCKDTLRGFVGIVLSFLAEISLTELKEYTEIFVQLTIGFFTVGSYVSSYLKSKKEKNE